MSLCCCTWCGHTQPKVRAVGDLQLLMSGQAVRTDGNIKMAKRVMQKSSKYWSALFTLFGHTCRFGAQTQTNRDTHIYIYISIYIYFLLCVYFKRYIYIFIHRYIYLYILRDFCSYIYLFICLFIYLFIYLSRKFRGQTSGNMDRQKKRHAVQTCSEVRTLISWEGAISEYQIFRFVKVILRDRCSTSYGLASLFRGRRSTVETWHGKIAKLIGTKPSAPHATFHFCGKPRRIASFLTLSTWKVDDVLQICFVSERYTSLDYTTVNYNYN